MENITKINDTDSIFPKMWATNVGVLCACSLITIYVIIVLAYHRVKERLKRKEKFSSLSWERKNALISKYLSIVMAVFALLNHCTSFGLQWEIYLSFNKEVNTVVQIEISNLACDVLGKLEVTAITVSVSIGYFFLWLRQRIFYVHPSLKNLNGKFLKVASFLIIPAWVIFFAVGLSCIYTLTRFTYQIQKGCEIDKDTNDAYIILIACWVSLSALTQLTLLSFFVYPLLKKSAWLKQNSVSKAHLFLRVRKACVITAVTLLSDILSAAIAASMPADNGNTFDTIYNINIVINLLAIILCFDHWQNLLFPWKKGRLQRGLSVTTTVRDDSKIHSSSVLTKHNKDFSSQQESLKERQNVLS